MYPTEIDMAPAMHKPVRTERARKTAGIVGKASGDNAPIAESGDVLATTYKNADKTIALIAYEPQKGVDAYVQEVSAATPMEIVEIERHGVQGIFLKDLSKRMSLPTTRIFAILGVPKATAEKKAASGEFVTGAGGQAAIGMIKLLGIARDIVDNSTAEGARNFDSAKWLGEWIERPQPALGGRKPSDLIDTPTGVEVVARLLGSIESGAYQ
jgi:putative toxin-antitoxin system antitoxin component (TIGR02293 family)